MTDRPFVPRQSNRQSRMPHRSSVRLTLSNTLRRDLQTDDINWNWTVTWLKNAMDELERSISPARIIANILVIAAMFAPLIWNVRRMVETYGAGFDIVSLSIAEQLGFVALLILPVVALRYWRIPRKSETTPSLFQ
ncbi:MAG: hypothetical protein HZA59_14635 [Hydrogenophilales bacterium]|nr:hypothetical protein [Hydrogenophilales bacterium]